MPALLIHMTLARRVASRTDIPARLAEAAAAHDDALLLGSVLPDLPYHDHFFHQVALHLARRAYLTSEWGDILHTRGTGQLALALLRHLQRAHLPPGEGEAVLALAAGYLTHHAIDRVVHPVINALVDRQLAAAGLHHNVLHARLERYQNLLFHRDELGHELVGSTYPRRLVRAMAGAGLWRPRLPRHLGQAVRAACLETHGRAPTRRELQDWLWGTTAYGEIMSSPLGRLEGLTADEAAEIRSTLYQGSEADLHAPLLGAMDAAARDWRAAGELLATPRWTREVRAVFLDKVPDVDLGTGQ